jgi:uncharacterized protein
VIPAIRGRALSCGGSGGHPYSSRPLSWFDAPVVRLLAEPIDFPVLLAEVARRRRVRGSVIHDARVAAICVAHGVERLLTRDRDFALFPELATEDPF